MDSIEAKQDREGGEEQRPPTESLGRGECGALSYEQSGQELRATLKPGSRALSWLPILAVGAAGTVAGAFFQRAEGAGFLVIPVVVLGWGAIFRTGSASERLALQQSSSYSRLQQGLVVHARREGKTRAPKFELDGLTDSARGFRGIVVASVPDTSVASRVCLVFRDRVLEIAAAPRENATAFADTLAQFCGARIIPEIRIQGPLASDATFDMLSILGVLLVTLAAPFIYVGVLNSTGFLVTCAIMALSPNLRADAQARSRSEAYQALSAKLVSAFESPAAP
jgi:hypothetical protein